jgi:hypothetical protein
MSGGFTIMLIVASDAIDLGCTDVVHGQSSRLIVKNSLECIAFPVLNITVTSGLKPR